MSEYGIFSVADIALGYGSPQIIAFLQSLAEEYNTRAYVIETDDPHRAPTALKNADRLHVTRAISVQPSWTLSAHLERNRMAEDILTKYRPPIVVLFSPLQLAAVANLPYRPHVILYMLEIDDGLPNDSLLKYHHLVDHYIFPEMQRMAYVMRKLRGPYPVTSLIYNCSDRAPEINLIKANERKPRIVYAGTLCGELTLAHEFMEEPLCHLPIDVYGNFGGTHAAELHDAFHALRNVDGEMQYQGYVPNSVLRQTLPNYAFSFVRWNPEAGLNYHYACPNKFFEAIASGVPPIAAPHPQCKQIIEAYECGVLAEDYTPEAMHDACKRALDLLGTPRYERMVENCLDAYEKRFNWKAQFAAFRHSLTPHKNAA